MAHSDNEARAFFVVAPQAIARRAALETIAVSRSRSPAGSLSGLPVVEAWSGREFA